MPLVIIKSDKRAREKPCLRCGYSLRGNLDAKYCPECGLSAWLSLNGNDALDASNPLWLRRLVIACIILLAAQAAGLFMWIGIEPALLQNLGQARRSIAILSLVGAVHFFAYNLGLGLLVWPERRYPDRLKTLRYCGWTVAVAGMLAGLGMLAVALRTSSLFLFRLPLHLMLLLEAVATFAYLHKLARRVPNSLLARLCAYLMLLPALSFAKAFPVFAFLVAFQALAVLEYLPWVYLPVFMGLFGWFIRIFVRAQRLAREQWGAETGPQHPCSLARRQI
jgi:hypothetical protein